MNKDESSVKRFWGKMKSNGDIRWTKKALTKEQMLNWNDAYRHNCKG